MFFTIFASCGSAPLEAPVSPTPVLSPIATEIPNIEPTSIPQQNETEPTATQMPVPTEDSTIFIPEPTVIPFPNDSCMYMNYSNSFPVVVTDSYIESFTRKAPQKYQQSARLTSIPSNVISLER